MTSRMTSIRRFIFNLLGRSRVIMRVVRPVRRFLAPEPEHFVVSFPKCGRTWLRVLMGAAVAQHRAVPIIEGVKQWLAVPSLPDGKRLKFTHGFLPAKGEPIEDLRLFLNYIGSRRRVFLFRDPRDVIVSYYFQLTKRMKLDEIPREFNAFVRHPSYGIDYVLQAMLAYHASIREDPGESLLIFYEDLHLDTVECLDCVFRFFGQHLTRETLEVAVHYGSFDNMHQIETDGTIKRLARLRTTDPNDKDAYKTRKGKVGSYTESLSEECIDYVEQRIATLLPAELGYAEPASAKPPKNRSRTACE